MSRADEIDSSSTALQRLGARSAQSINALLREIRCLYFVFRNPGTPWYARALLFFPLAYLCSPIQLIPNFIPVLGQMDDLLVIWLATKMARRLVDPKILQECRERAAAVSFAIRFSGKSFYARHSDPPVPQSNQTANSSQPVATNALGSSSVHARGETAQVRRRDPDEAATWAVDVSNQHQRDGNDDRQSEQQRTFLVQSTGAVRNHDVGQQGKQ